MQMASVNPPDYGLGVAGPKKQIKAKASGLLNLDFDRPGRNHMPLVTIFPAMALIFGAKDFCGPLGSSLSDWLDDELQWAAVLRQRKLGSEARWSCNPGAFQWLHCLSEVERSPAARARR